MFQTNNQYITISYHVIAQLYIEYPLSYMCFFYPPILTGMQENVQETTFLRWFKKKKDGCLPKEKELNQPIDSQKSQR